MQNAAIAYARKFGLPVDEALLLQGAHTQLLVAVARGDIDLNQLAREELASRGLNTGGQWVGFPAASEIAAAHHVR
jgi:hypothetical protein